MIADTNCERVVVSTLLTYGSALATVRPFLSADCFTDHIHYGVYKAILSVEDKGEIPDQVNVFKELSQQGSPIGLQEILNLDKVCLTDITQYALRLRELKNRRDLQNVGYRILQASQNEIEPIDSLLSKARMTIEEASDYSSSSSMTLKDAIIELQQRINDNLSGKTLAGTHTGLSALDRKGGLHPADLVIVAGTTSAGKTSLATTITLNAMMNDEKVAFYSMEMMKHQLAARIVSMVSKVSSSKMLYGKPDEFDFAKIDKAIGSIPMDNLLIDDKATSNIETIIASIRSFHAKYGIKGAVIDYLQILNVNTNNRLNKEQLMAEAARRLKNLAKDLGIWIIALSQLNRDNDNPVPSLDRLRDSGQIAEAADIVLLIYRPEVFGKPYPKPFELKNTHNTAMIDVAKGRNIGVFKFLCTFVPELTMFLDEEAENIAIDEEETPF